MAEIHRPLAEGSLLFVVLDGLRSGLFENERYVRGRDDEHGNLMPVCFRLDDFEVGIGLARVLSDQIAVLA